MLICDSVIKNSIKSRITAFNSFIARSAERGTEAVRQLEGEGLAPQLVCLDVSSEESVCAARQVVQEQYNRLDVLVNNAGVFFGVRC